MIKGWYYHYLCNLSLFICKILFLFQIDNDWPQVYTDKFAFLSPEIFIFVFFFCLSFIFFFCDHISPYSGRASPCVLINIPDGHQKEMPKAGSKHKETKEVSSKEVRITCPSRKLLRFDL